MRIIPTSLLCLLSLNAQSNVIQYFAGISYNNPSELFKIKKEEYLFGGTGSYADLGFTGSALNFNTMGYNYGGNHSKTYTFMPYGRLARRVNKDVVVSLDVTEPFNSNLNWGADAFTRYANTENLLIDVDVSPKLSYGLTKKLQIGAGINFNFLVNNEVNWAFPTSATTYANLTNPTSAFGVGYNLGLTYIINKSNFLGVTYYSKIKQNTTGVSTLGTFANPYLSMNFFLPTTIIVTYTHIFNPKWLISLAGFQTQWSLNQFIRLYNTAAPPPMSNFVFKMNFRDSYAYLAVIRKQMTDKAGLALIGMVDDGPEKDFLRPITFPSYIQYFAGIAGDYSFNKNTSVELLYGHVFSNPGINNFVPVNGNLIPFTTGQMKINVDVLALKVKIAG